MNKSELEDILSFDATAASFSAVGTFFLSGSFWLIVEYLANRQAGQPLGNLMLICLGFASFGGFMLVQGWLMGRRKRNKIERIFNETTLVNASATPTARLGRNASTR